LEVLITIEIFLVKRVHSFLLDWIDHKDVQKGIGQLLDLFLLLCPSLIIPDSYDKVAVKFKLTSE